MIISEINPFIRYAKTYILLPHISFRAAPDCRIFFVVDAEKTGLMQIGTENYPLKTNSLFFISANTPYKFTVNGVTKVISINFDFTQYRTNEITPFETLHASRTSNKNQSNIELFIDYTPFNEHIVLENADSQLDLLNKILKEYSMTKPHYREASSAMLKLLLIKIVNTRERILRHSQPYYTKNKELVRKIKDFIHSHYKENLTNEIIACQVDYHSYHLNRIFSKIEGISLHKYLTNYRILMAEKMLLETDAQISFIATEVGFCNETSFTQNFKIKNNMTPSKYRYFNRGGL